MKFVLLVHSHPQPWGHPTSDLTPEYQALRQDEKDRRGQLWDDVMAQADERGEVVYALALGDPADGLVLRDGQPDSSEPYGAPDNLAGMFVLEVADRERAVEIARAFSCPGDTIELRTVWEG